MKSIAISGMTASQASYRSFHHRASFIGCVASMLKDNNVAVHFIEPSVLLKKSDLDQYDSVLLGVAPILSIAANKAYGILHMINLLKNDSRLRLFVDAPEPAKIAASLRAIDKNNDDIIKQFYSGRKQYSDVVGNKKILESALGGVRTLFSHWDYVTLYPSSPFVGSQVVKAQLPCTDVSTVLPVEVDSALISSEISSTATSRSRRWVVDSMNSRWFKSLQNTLGNSAVQMKSNRLSTDSDVEKMMLESQGSILSVQDDGMLWWSYRMSQAMNSRTPIVSDWKITSILGDSWSLLPANVEEMDYVDIYELSVAQRKRYTGALMNAQDTIHTLKNGLGL